MDLLDALYCRKTVTKYTTEKINDSTLDRIREYYGTITGMPEGIKTDIELIDNMRNRRIKTGVFSHVLPYCIVLYSEEAPKKYTNIGFKLQKLSLYLCTLGFGSVYLQNCRIPANLMKKGSLEACAVLAFGHSKGDYTRDKNEADRMTSVQLSIYQETPHKWISRIIDAARFAPSYKNDQPWRFLVAESEIHIFSKYHNADKMKKTDEIDFGGLYANIMSAAEELWLDVDLIRLDNISHKNFSKDQYVISAVLRSKDSIY